MSLDTYFIGNVDLIYIRFANEILKCI